MDYPKIAIIIWIITSIIIAILGKRSAFTQLGKAANKITSPIWWRAYFLCCAGIGGVIAIGLTYLIRSLA
ncbi:MAG TPA: hypothetical protein VGS79_26115 [Puia sp.]|nr:hypothetical protein [Puia sp.]